MNITDKDILSTLPNTITQIAERIRTNRSTTRRRLNAMHDAGLIHIGGWILCANGVDAPIYYAGEGDDVICPSKRENANDPTKHIPKSQASWVDALTYPRAFPT